MYCDVVARPDIVGGGMWCLAQECVQGLWENMEERAGLEDLSVDGMILQCVYRNRMVEFGLDSSGC